MSELVMYTVYDHPSDYRHHFVSRKFIARADDVVRTNEIELFTSLDELRRKMMERGLACVNRQETDDLTIIETWF